MKFSGGTHVPQSLTCLSPVKVLKRQNESGSSDSVSVCQTYKSTSTPVATNLVLQAPSKARF
jgi:hypothetical protein